MPDFLPNIPLPSGEYVNLYAATGISVGTSIRVFNTGSRRINLYEQADEPDNASGHIPLTACRDGSTSVSIDFTNSPSGVWAYSNTLDGEVNVQVIV